MLTFEQVEENVAELKRRVEATMAKCARTDEVKIVAATKTQPKELIDFVESKRLLTDVGENRVQEFLTKYTPASLLRWHLIGQLQSNKVKYIIDKAALIHSLDRYSLADEIQKQAVKHGLTAHCLIEVNMGSELSKGGIEPETLESFVDGLRAYSAIEIDGIMSVMPNVELQPLIGYYRKFSAMFDALKRVEGGNIHARYCSCGMTNDYEVALEYGGSNMIRPGRVLFGQRN